MTLIISAAILGLSIYNICLQASTNRPKLSIIQAELRIISGANPPQSVLLNIGNVGRQSAMRGKATLLTIDEVGAKNEKFGEAEIVNSSSSTTLVPTFGYGSLFFTVDMKKFLGLFVVCLKYSDEKGNAYKDQDFTFKLGTKLVAETGVTRLDEVPVSKQALCSRYP